MTTWNLEQSRRDEAANLAEAIVKGLSISTSPVDPFRIIHSERRRVAAYGDDFGDAFDGRLEYQRPKFLIFYNTKYDAWPHKGKHHPKVKFTVAHELGHFFLNAHRTYLKHGGRPHGSQTEFVSNNNSEREADAFAAGLLMPRFLVDSVINSRPPTLDTVKTGRDVFEVSLTSMMVRTVQVSDFPCAMCSVRGGRVEWGFTSNAFKSAGAYKVNRGESVTSRPALAFLGGDLSRYQEREDSGDIRNWLEWEKGRLDVMEYYVTIPSVNQVLVFITADEDDLLTDDGWS